MHAPRGVLSSGMLAVSSVRLSKRTCLTGCLHNRQPVSVGSRRPLGARRSHLLCISHSLLPILISHTHTRPSPPPLTTFQSSARTDVTPSWCAYKDDTQEPERRSNTRTLGTKHTNSRKKKWDSWIEKVQISGLSDIFLHSKRFLLLFKIRVRFIDTGEEYFCIILYRAEHTEERLWKETNTTEFLRSRSRADIFSDCSALAEVRHSSWERELTECGCSLRRRHVPTLLNFQQWPPLICGPGRSLRRTHLTLCQTILSLLYYLSKGRGTKSQSRCCTAFMAKRKQLFKHRETRAHFCGVRFARKTWS